MLQISSFYTCNKNQNHMMYVSEIQRATVIIFCLFGSFFCPFTHLMTRKIQIFKKNEKKKKNYEKKDIFCPDFGINWYSSCTAGIALKNETHICYCELDFLHLFTWRETTIFAFPEGGTQVCRQYIRLRGLVKLPFQIFPTQSFPNSSGA